MNVMLSQEVIQSSDYSRLPQISVRVVSTKQHLSTASNVWLFISTETEDEEDAILWERQLVL